MLDLLMLLLRVISATLRGHRDLVLENLLLRHQLIGAANDRRGSGHGTAGSGSCATGSAPTGADISS